MADEVKKEEVKPVTDTFGVDRNPVDGAPIPPPAPAEVKKEEEKKPAEVAATDIEKNPLVIELKQSIATLTENLAKETGDKTNMGKNLSAMRTRLEKLEKGDKEGEAEAVFKKEDIKRVKDYTKDEQEAMTETEKRLIESDADMKERINKMVADAAAKDTETSEKAQTETEKADAKKAFDTKVQGLATTLAGDDKDMANKIIIEFNQFADNDKLDDKQLAERLAKAAKLVPDFKPQREQASPRGAAPAADTNKDDPHGVGKIVDDVQKSKQGGSYAL